MKKSKPNVKPSLTAVRNVLKEAQFNPRKPGTMKVIADQGSPEFYEHAAMVAIERAKELRTGEQDPTTQRHYHRQLTEAIQLLTLARIYNG